MGLSKLGDAFHLFEIAFYFCDFALDMVLKIEKIVLDFKKILKNIFTKKRKNVCELVHVVFAFYVVGGTVKADQLMLFAIRLYTIVSLLIYKTLGACFSGGLYKLLDFM